MSEGIPNTLLVPTDSLEQQPAVSSRNQEVLEEGRMHEMRIREYIVRIEALTTQIELLQKKSEPLQEKCQALQIEVDMIMNTLEKEDRACASKLAMFEELQVEYKKLIDATEYQKLYNQKKQSIDVLLSEISQIELDVLQVELQRLNEEIVLQPLLDEIALLEAERKNLLLQKEHYAATYLNHLHRLGLPNTAVHSIGAS